MRTPLWLYNLLVRMGKGHWCEYDDSTHPNYSGFTAGICYKKGLHKGRQF